jgi:anhydro-N-acetylmuramic acid kinase
MDSKQQYKVIGLMSGTSLDGVDLACCILKHNDAGWWYKLERAHTVEYTSAWKTKLSNAHNLTANELLQFHIDYGKYLGDLCKKFIVIHDIKRVDFISSHGHTLFHQPKKGLTFQLGSGDAIHAASKLPVVCDFRSLDVALGGEGAPLVPIGDQHLFHEYDICLNLGGIANLSVRKKSGRVAEDVCFLNMGLNHLSSLKRRSFDLRGAMASKGELQNKMLDKLSKTYVGIREKNTSLGREIFESRIKPILDDDKLPVEDRLRTFVESCANEISSAIKRSKKQSSVLCTGGGAFNSFLIFRMVELLGNDGELIIPEDEIVKFKEAMVFAFLGVLKVCGEINCLKSVTGASRDCSSGVMIGF